MIVRARGLGEILYGNCLFGNLKLIQKLLDGSGIDGKSASDQLDIDLCGH